MFFTLLTPVTLKEVMPEAPQPSLFDEIKQKMQTLKLELTCSTDQNIQLPSMKAETFDGDSLESLGSSALSQCEAPLTPRASRFNEDGEREYE